MITVPPALLAHPTELQQLAGELLALRFDRGRLTEALLSIQEQADAARTTADPDESDRHERTLRSTLAKDWSVTVH